MRSSSARPSAVFAVPVVLAVASVLAGCPIYSADSCAEDPACTPPAYADAGPVDTGTPPVDAGNCSEGCDPGYVCTSLSSGRYECVAYDCRAEEKACTAPETCNEQSPGVWVCGVPAGADCGTTGCVAGYSCVGEEAGKRVCVSTDPNACTEDAECVEKTGEGSLCLGGSCKAPKDLCSDSTQCKAGSTCVDGRCAPKCSSSSCPAGYTCDAETGLCTGGAAACDDATPCASGKTCVAGRCVDPCATDGSCKAGLVCVGAVASAEPSTGGCLVDDRPVFFCDKDGTKEGTRDTCAEGSICLHHNCYIACSGPEDTTTCSTADKFKVCKSVTTSTGDFNVCGSSTNLGSECDPTATPPKTCSAGKVCIDGFCK